MDAAEMRRRLALARVGHLATVSGGGIPHLVPCCFALEEDTIYSAVDAKPKRTQSLRRLKNLRATGRACLLVDHYAEDWSELWWVRVDGRGRVVEQEPERARALAALSRKYDQYRQVPPPGPTLALDITLWRGWPS
jgi:PPOX class probable F420-dependent enzyme